MLGHTQCGENGTDWVTAFICGVGLSVTKEKCKEQGTGCNAVYVWRKKLRVWGCWLGLQIGVLLQKPPCTDTCFLSLRDTHMHMINSLIQCYNGVWTKSNLRLFTLQPEPEMFDRDHFVCIDQLSNCSTEDLWLILADVRLPGLTQRERQYTDDCNSQ